MAADAEAWVVEGRISDNPHQHPIDGDRAREALYVDTVSDGQLVAYVKGEKPPRGAWVRFTGTVLSFEVTSKRPGSTKKFPVKQLSVDKTDRLSVSDAVQTAIDRIRGGEAPKDGSGLVAEAKRAGKDALPVLIAGAEDPRTGDACAAAMQAVLLPPGYAKPSGPVFASDDWGEWWRKNREKSLDEIHAALKPIADAHFKSGGAPQKVP